MEKKLYEACDTNRFEDAKEILTKNPAVNVNWMCADASDLACLHIACNNGRSLIVPLLLAHPDIIVNQRSTHRCTPFLLACSGGRTPVVQLMLKDARVTINEPDSDGFTPLSCAASNGYLEVIKWMIASGRDLDLGQAEMNCDAIGKAKNSRNKPEVASLLERFKKNRTQTTSEIRKELGINDFPLVTPSKLTRQQYVDFVIRQVAPVVAPNPLTPVVGPVPDRNPFASDVDAVPPTPVVTAQQKAIFLTELDSRKDGYPITSLLKCNLCSQPDDLIAVRNPKTLPCLHSFCQICLEQQDATVNKQQGGSIKCKQCSAAFKTPSDGMQSLECCAFIDSLSKSTQGPKKDLNRVNCDICEEAEATEHCNKCDENYCAGCALAHKKSKATSTHPVVPLSEASPNRILHCQKHPAQEIDTYCQSCKEPTCTKCLPEKHSGHEFCPLSEVAASSKDDIVTFTFVAAAREKEAEKCLPNFDAAIFKLEGQCTAAEKEIDATRVTLIAAVNTRFDELKSKAIEVRNTTIREKAQVESAVVQLREFRVFNEGLLVQGTTLEIAGTHKDVNARNEVLEKMQIPSKPSKEPVIKFQPGNVDQLKQAIATIGAISTSN